MADIAPIETPDLLLYPILPDTLVALKEQDLARASIVQGTELPAELLESMDEFFLSVQHERMTSRPEGRGWCTRAIIRKSDGTVIGHGGFHGPPEDVGRAEIGYTVLGPFRRRGYATQAAKALIDYARANGSEVVFASVAPTNAPSLRVVEKLGFVQTGVQIDEIDGEELVFELDLTR